MRLFTRRLSRYNATLAVVIIHLWRPQREGKGKGHGVFGSSTDGCRWFLGRRSFSDLVYLHIYEQKISFFHHKSGFLTIVWLLLHFTYNALECQLRMSKEKGSYKNLVVVDRIRIFDFFADAMSQLAPYLTL